MKRKVTSQDIEIAIANYYDPRVNIIVPNVSWGLFSHECDILVVRKTNYCIEVEIKISKQDLKADFKKEKQHIDKKNRIKELYYAFPVEMYDDCKELIPEECGIFVYLLDGSLSLERKAKERQGAKPLTDKEVFQVARLGTLRIWSLKRKIQKLIEK